MTAGLDAASPELPSSGRLLGVDYGTRRIGLAISTPEQTIASPLENYTRRTPTLDAAHLQRIVQEERVVGLVVGLPVHLRSGDEGEKARAAREFGAWAGQATGRPVVFYDERCSTAAAQDWLRDAGVPRSKWRERLDKLAAQIVLQSYLESRTLQRRTRADDSPGRPGRGDAASLDEPDA